MYRMSLARSRIVPEGRGQPNQKGVDHYKRVIDNLLENNITPYVTMFHWDLPVALPGGWQNRDTSYAFADYAGYIAGQLSDRSAESPCRLPFRRPASHARECRGLAAGTRWRDRRGR